MNYLRKLSKNKGTAGLDSIIIFFLRVEAQLLDDLTLYSKLVTKVEKCLSLVKISYICWKVVNCLILLQEN